MSESRGVIHPDTGKARFAAALATARAPWTYTLETSREGRADVIAMAECQRDSEALTMPSAASSAIQTVMVTLTGANNEPGFNNDSGVVVTADEDNAIGNSSEQDVSDNLSVSALVAGRLSAG